MKPSDSFVRICLSLDVKTSLPASERAREQQSMIAGFPGMLLPFFEAHANQL